MYKRQDINTDNTFSKRFVKGQVLFGRRRAYQRKAAIAEFDGICSGDITVIEAIEGKMVSELLPFIIQTPVFFDYANRGSAGSLSPRVKWEHLLDYEFELPSLEEQKVLADKLWAAYRLKEAYKKLLVATDEMVKSQFIEMYYNTHNKQTLESVCPIMNKGITPKYVESSSVLVINQACIHWDGQRLGNIKYHNEEIPVRKRILESGDVLLNATGNGTLGRCCVFICPSDNNTYINDGHVIALSTDRAVILPEVLNTYLSLNDTQAEIYRQYVTGSTNQVDIVFSDIKKMKVPVPSMDEQILFVEVLTQADKSKFGDFKSQFIEMFGDSSVVRLEDKIATQSGGTPNTKKLKYYEGGNIPWLSSSEVNQGYIFSTEKFITQEGLDNSSARWIPKDSVLIAMYGATAGRVGLSTIPLTTNQAVCALLPCSSFNPIFLYYAVCQKTPWMISQCRGAAQPNISQGIIRSMELPIPPMAKQMQFVSIAKQADKSKSVIQKALVYLNDIQSDELGKIA